MTDLNLSVDGISDGQQIPEQFAFGIRTESEPFTFGPNLSPAMRWDAGPDGTKSYAVIMHDRSAQRRPLCSTLSNDGRPKNETCSAFFSLAVHLLFADLRV